MLYEWIRKLEFAFPYAFGLLILIPFLIWWRKKRAPARQSKMMVSTAHSFTVGSGKTAMRGFPFFLRVLALICLVIALARPQLRNDMQKTEGDGIDIVLCMDVSGSMGSRDILPSRMEVAKEMAEEFVKSRPVDRIGLVIFSGESFSQVPVTSDKNTLITQIRSLDTRRYLVDGTVIGEGLATAVDRLTETTGRSKVIILITDGKEDPPETRLIDPLTALEIAKSNNVKVYTIGMGGNPVAPVTLPGQPVRQQSAAVDFIDEQLLRRIAEETGGRYFRARDKDGLRNTYAQIDRMEKVKVEITNFSRYKEMFWPFILAALGLILLEWLLRFTIFRKFP